MSSQAPPTYGPTPGSGRASSDASALPPSGSSPADRDWTVQATDRFESLVSSVRDKTTVPITKLARLVVFGIVAAAVAVVALVLVIVAVTRIIDVYLPFHPYGRRVWVGYAGLGAIFLLLGAFCWSKRSRKPQETH